jgi:fumarate hydratase class I
MFRMSKPIILRTPLDREDTRRLRAGQEVLISGTVITARDAAHRYLAARDDSDRMPFDLEGAVIYHCGPLMRRTRSGWEAVSAGPTTSARMEIYEPGIVARYHVGAILGKGGMGTASAEALQKVGAVYLAAAAGAGALLATRILKVETAWKLEEFGEPEAMWKLEVGEFPAIVAMDSSGGNLYRDVEANSAAALRRMV